MSPELALFSVLWKRIAKDEIRVSYQGVLPHQAGSFVPVASRGPRDPAARIDLLRPYYDLPSDEPHDRRNEGAPAELAPVDLVAETMTLAHEYGHALSWRAGNRVPEYVAATIQLEAWWAWKAGEIEERPRPLSQTQLDLVRAEEARAWELGRAVLRELGFVSWDRFDRHVAEALERYEDVFRAMGASDAA